ncbi:MAG TPA: NAD-dependent epimerase/dehydratase family protein [Verrucomicrobiota bacterium]|nr:NAD-dependent epimerase/dehydratase family protein [Verrucomicrobiota bacterium]
MKSDWIVSTSEPVLVTGANGFLGCKVVETLLSHGFSRIRCLVRPTSIVADLEKVIGAGRDRVEVLAGNLLSPEFCRRAAQGVSVVYHLAAGIEKSFPGSFLNTVVTTRNLLDAVLDTGALKRFVNISSFAVYSTTKLRRGQLQDENCPVEEAHEERFDAYCYAKVKQDEIVQEYGAKRGLPYVILRPGAVYGPGTRQAITGRVGIGTFGVFLHLGGSNPLPLTYIDNCAEAIVLAGVKAGIDGHTFNIVDDELPTSRRFLKLYKRHVRPFRSLYVPYSAFYLFCVLWEKYARWSQGQLPPAFNRHRCSAVWKRVRYSNRKLKELVGWSPRVSFNEASQRYFSYLKASGKGVR